MKFRCFIKKNLLISAFLLVSVAFYAQDFETDYNDDFYNDFDNYNDYDVPEITDEEETYSTTAWSLDSKFYAEIEGSNIILKDADTLLEEYTIETPYAEIKSIQFVNPGFYSTSDDIYYITFITASNIVEMRQIGFYSDDLGRTTYYDEIIFSMKGPEPSENQSDAVTENQPEEQTEQDFEEADDTNETTDEEAPTEEEGEAESEEESEEEEKHEYQALALIRYKNTDAISFKLKVSYIPKPYILGVSLSAGYTQYKLIQPFYFGGYIEPHVGIPQKAFPYKYELAGTSINGPLIVGGKLYAPFGICVFPFQRNIEFFVEIEPGITFNMMWNAKFGKNSITSKLYPAFYGALRTGASYKGFSFFIEGNYDAILGFGVSAGIGYSLNIYTQTTPDYTPSLE